MTVTVAVYTVLAANLVGESDQVMAVVYWPLLAIEATGVAPVAGAVIEILAVLTIIAVSGNR